MTGRKLRSRQYGAQRRRQWHNAQYPGASVYSEEIQKREDRAGRSERDIRTLIFLKKERKKLDSYRDIGYYNKAPV